MHARLGLWAVPESREEMGHARGGREGREGSWAGERDWAQGVGWGLLFFFFFYFP